MKVEQIREIAREFGVKPGKLNKVELVRRIQSEEGNFDCFATATEGYCDQQTCLWRDDCLTAARKLN